MGGRLDLESFQLGVMFINSGNCSNPIINPGSDNYQKATKPFYQAELRRKRDKEA